MLHTRFGRPALSLVLLDCLLLVSGTEHSSSLVLAGFAVATAALLALIGTLAVTTPLGTSGRRRAPVSVMVAGPSRQADPDAAGHVRPRAPGRVA